MEVLFYELHHYTVSCQAVCFQCLGDVLFLDAYVPNGVQFFLVACKLKGLDGVFVFLLFYTLVSKLNKLGAVFYLRKYLECKIKAVPAYALLANLNQLLGVSYGDKRLNCRPYLAFIKAFLPYFQQLFLVAGQFICLYAVVKLLQP